MTLRDLIPHLDKPMTSGSLDTEITGLAYDSRQAGPGIAFVALRGSSVDGHAFIPKAIEAGCAAIIAEQAPPDGCTTPWIHVRHSRIALADAAAALNGHPGKNMTLIGVTGTNGKTTTAFLAHHLMNLGQMRCGLLGTIFYDLGGQQVPATHTTPESLEIQTLLSQMRGNGCRACAMEISSHALDQHRAHGLPFASAIFTNLTQDHLDYHADFDDYRRAKMKLFSELLPAGAPAVINADSPELERFEAVAQKAGLRTFTVGWRGRDLRISEALPRGTGQDLVIQWGGGPSAGNERKVHLPLIGEFQALNALCAAGIAIALGDDVHAVLDGLTQLKGVHGRLELVGQTAGKAPVFVDYAHTPDGLNVLLRAARPHVRGKLIVVFGCGGDRDATKRPIMGDVARRLADEVIVTDDNPRSEEPAAIRAAICKGTPDASEIGDRASAIQEGVRRLKPGDALVIAGKGHETGQIVKGVTIPFSDFDVARDALKDVGGTHG